MSQSNAAPQGAHRARKRFGQNFLVDQDIIHRIADAIAPEPGQHLVEIGPGQAALTRVLIERAGSVDAVEIDRDLVARLTQTFSREQLRLHEADALEFDFGSLPSPLRIVGNLPYNISTPILFRLCEYESRISDMSFMLQKEVVDRMVAAPGGDARGRLSVMLQYRFKVTHCFDVPPTAFRPMPAVNSAIVRLTPLGEQRLRPRDEKLFAQVTAAAFSQRRKMLRNSLAQWLISDDWEQLGIAPTLRAEALGNEDFVKIADHITAKTG